MARLASPRFPPGVLIDSAMRRPALHSAFVKIGPGLTDSSKLWLRAHDVLRRDTLTPLDYITGGQLAPHAANLLCLPENCNQLLAKLRTGDTLIIGLAAKVTVADTSFIAQQRTALLWQTWEARPPYRSMNSPRHHCRGRPQRGRGPEPIKLGRPPTECGSAPHVERRHRTSSLVPWAALLASRDLPRRHRRRRRAANHGLARPPGCLP